MAVSDNYSAGKQVEAAITIFGDGLKLYVGDRLKEFHQQLLLYFDQNELPYMCTKQCTSSDIEWDNTKGWGINCPVCSHWLGQLIENHISPPDRSALWNNINPTTLSSDPLEMFKVYQSSCGRTEVYRSEAEAKVSKILGCIKNCKYITQFVRGQAVSEIEEAIANIDIKAGVSRNEYQDLNQRMVAFLKNLTCPPGQTMNDINNTLKRINEMDNRPCVTYNRHVEDKDNIENLKKIKNQQRNQVTIDYLAINYLANILHPTYKSSEKGMDENCSSPKDVMPCVQQTNITDDIIEIKTDIRELKQVTANILQNTETGNLRNNKESSSMEIVSDADIGLQERIGRSSGSHQSSAEISPSALQTGEWESSDGRIIELDASKVEPMLGDDNLLSKGAFGKTYVYDEQNGTRKLVIKRIRCKNKNDNRRTATNEMMAARLKHPGIVPLFARCWDAVNEIIYYVMPYMENKDLCTAIKLHGQPESPNLTKQTRLRILFQLASGIEFLHNEVHDFRKPYVHGDITSRNIVLDVNDNMRLLDFGLSKEMKGYSSGLTRASKDEYGTPGYSMRPIHKFTTKNDIFNYGVVGLELITGQPPIGMYKECLYQDTNILSHHKDCIEKVWGTVKATPTQLMEWIPKCISKTITATEITANLESLLRGMGVDKYCYIPDDNPKCVICMVNPTMKNNVLNHRCDLQLCVPCVRSSHLNPIKCPSCHDDIHPSIGYCWGAVLVAGGDRSNSEVLDCFQRDVQRVYDVITSEGRKAVGIRPEDVIVIQTETPDNVDDIKNKFKEAFETLFSKKHITTLFVYMTGHGDTSGGFMLHGPGFSHERITEDNLNELLQCHFQSGTLNKFIMFLDYCCPRQSLNYKAEDLPTTHITLLKVTACSPTEKANLTLEHGSIFTKTLVQCLSGDGGKAMCSSDCKVCNDRELSMKHIDGFISLDYLVEYIGRHMEKSGCSTPRVSTKGMEWRDTKIAYYIKKQPEIEFVFEFGNDQIPHYVDQLPDSIEELRENLHKAVTEALGPNNMGVKYFKEAAAVMVKTGSRPHDTMELLTIQRIESAWNNRCKLFVKSRDIHQILSGKAIIFPKIATVTLLNYIKHTWNKTCLTDEGEHAIVFTIPVLYLKNNDILHEASDEFHLCSKILHEEVFKCVSASKNLKDKCGQVVLTFPIPDPLFETIEDGCFLVHFEETIPPRLVIETTED